MNTLGWLVCRHVFVSFGLSTYHFLQKWDGNLLLQWERLSSLDPGSLFSAALKWSLITLKQKRPLYLTKWTTAKISSYFECICWISTDCDSVGWNDPTYWDEWAGWRMTTLLPHLLSNTKRRKYNEKMLGSRKGDEQCSPIAHYHRIVQKAKKKMKLFSMST